MTVHFMSPVKKIDQLLMREIPTGRPINVAKVVRIGRTVLCVTADGKVYTSRGKSVSYMLDSGELTDSTMRALQRLGVITKQQLQAHLDAAKKRTAERERKWAAEGLLRDAATLGIKLTKAQIAAAEKAGGKRPQQEEPQE